MSTEPETPAPGGQFLVYQTEDGKLKIDVRFEGETVWLTQQHMAELFQTTKQNIGQHLKSIFAEGELVQDSVVKDSFTTAADGKNYLTRFYSLDAIISVGYRVKSAVATRFRIWAITGQTAAEIIHERVDAAKPNLGLTNWRGAVIRKQDVAIAKSYLSEPELEVLNNLVEQYLIFAQGQAMRRVPMHMADWIEKLNGFLTLNERDILTHRRAGFGWRPGQPVRGQWRPRRAPPCRGRGR
jgi:hypothetical protein